MIATIFFRCSGPGCTSRFVTKVQGLHNGSGLGSEVYLKVQCWAQCVPQTLGLGPGRTSRFSVRW